MKQTNNHGGSFGKSLLLLLRSISNLIAFAVLWYGLISGVAIIGIPLWIPGAILTAICIACNLILPCIAASKINKISSEHRTPEQQN